MTTDSNVAVEPKVRVTIVLPAELHEVGKQLAKADHRDFSGEVAALIEAEAKRNPPTPTPPPAAQTKPEAVAPAEPAFPAGHLRGDVVVTKRGVEVKMRKTKAA